MTHEERARQVAAQLGGCDHESPPPYHESPPPYHTNGYTGTFRCVASGHRLGCGEEVCTRCAAYGAGGAWYCAKHEREAQQMLRRDDEHQRPPFYWRYGVERRRP